MDFINIQCHFYILIQKNIWTHILLHIKRKQVFRESQAPNLKQKQNNDCIAENMFADASFSWGSVLHKHEIAVEHTEHHPIEHEGLLLCYSPLDLLLKCTFPPKTKNEQSNWEESAKEDRNFIDGGSLKFSSLLKETTGPMTLCMLLV